jgi:hypothetical protein
MSDHKQRMLDEHSQLIERIGKLKSFLWGDLYNSLDADAKTLLIQQLAYMQGYETILATRISRS